MTGQQQEPPATLARHLAFWRREQADRPLAGAYLGGYEVPDVYLAAQDGELLQPQHLVPERFFDMFIARCKTSERLGQDLFRPLSPLYSVPWLEAVLGCPIRVHAQACWAEALLAADMPLETLQPGWSRAWLEAAIRFVRALAGMSNSEAGGSGRYPVAGLFLRGPADVVAALLGTERMCYAFYDDPQQVQRLARLAAEAWIEVTRLIYQEIPRFHGGYVDPGRWLYAPAQCAYSSEDACALLSSSLYRTHFLPYNQMMVDAFPYGYIHRHSASMHNLAALLDLKTSWAIEVTMDPGGPSVGEMLPLFRKIQEQGRPLIVFGLDSARDVARLVGALSPGGLCVVVQADTEEEARTLLAIVRGG
jgi:hypothetical protein